MYLPNTLAAVFAAKLIAEGKPVPAYVTDEVE